MCSFKEVLFLLLVALLLSLLLLLSEAVFVVLLLSESTLAALLELLVSTCEICVVSTGGVVELSLLGGGSCLAAELHASPV